MAKPMSKGLSGLLLLSAAVALLCFTLALWQWQRAVEKEALIAKLETQMARPPQLINRLPEKGLSAYLPLLAALQSDNAHSLLWDNQMMEGRVGYRVLTPAQDRLGRWWLVERGWLAAPAYRDQLPEVPPLPAEVLSGWLWPLKPRALELEETAIEPGWPKRIQQPEHARLQLILERPLMPWLIKLAPESPGALKALPPQPVAMGPERHQGYALQWLLLGLFLSLVSGWLLWRGWPNDKGGSKDAD